ncbi:MAG TPA: DinB family protein [bacterium]|nr:DinB family protein [bacterium]
MSPANVLTLHDLVVDHVYTLLEKEGWQWQPPLSEALGGLTAAQAAWRPAPDRHSIWQIVRHLILWKSGVLDAWSGNPREGQDMKARDWGEAAGSEADWERDRQTLLAISVDLLSRVHALDDAGLSKPIDWYKGRHRQPIAMRVVRTATHDAYHTGQMQYLRVLQGLPRR